MEVIHLLSLFGCWLVFLIASLVADPSGNKKNFFYQQDV